YAAIRRAAICHAVAHSVWREHGHARGPADRAVSCQLGAAALGRGADGRDSRFLWCQEAIMAGPFASTLLLGSIFLLAATTAPAVAGDDASFYAGKQITFIVGTGAGGGNDLY